MKVIKFLFTARLGRLARLAPVGLLGACAPATASGSVAVAAPVYAPGPGLTYVAPGVEVVADWDTPVFFADNLFWYWDAGLWYRSSVLGGERIAVRDVPVGVARIRNPGGYAHFRVEAHAIRPVPAGRLQRVRMASRRR